MATTLMTELEAVNTLLSVIGEAPVNTLNTTISADVAGAKAALDEVRAAVCEEDWRFCTEEEYPLPKDVNGFINLPQNTAKLHIKRGRFGNVDPVIRGTRLYDRYNNTSVFTQDLTANSITLILDWDDLPQLARRYITLRAARVFQRRRVGSVELDGFTQADEFRARGELEAHDARDGYRTLFEHPVAARTVRRLYGDVEL